MKVFRSLVLTWLLIGIVAEATAQDKPNAILFDEFGKVNAAELKKRIGAFNDRLRKNAWSENFENAVIFFYGQKEREQSKAEAAIIKLLNDGCYDCRGWNVRIHLSEPAFRSN